MRARAPLIIAILLFLATLACYSRVLGQHFVSYDDNAYVTDNAYVKAGLTLRSAAWAFTNDSYANWHPLTWLSLMVDHQIYGLEPSGYKLTNVIFHAANAVLLLLTLRRLTGSTWRSALVAALFALHPLHVESVAWISERKDVLSTFFGFLALWTYAGYARHPNWRRYAAVTVCMALSLLAKPTWVTLPFLLLLLDYWPLQRWPQSNPNRPLGQTAQTTATYSTSTSGISNFTPRTFSFLVLEKLPFLLLSITSSIVTYIAQKTGGAVASVDRIPIHTRMVNAMMTYLAYLDHMIWPVNLAFFYPYRQSWPPLWIALAAAFLLAVTVVALACARRLPSLPVGWFWYLGMLVPTIGLVQVGDQAMADRYTYVPLVGIFLAVVWAIPQRWLAKPGLRMAAGAAALFLLAVLSFLTWTQIGYWQDDKTLCFHALAAVPNNYVAEINYGGVLLTSGQPTEALIHFENAVQMRPDFSKTHYDAARALAALHRLPDALDEYRKALTLRSRGSDAPAQIARILQAQGKPADALAALEAGARSDPDNLSVLIPLGMTLASHQQPEAATKIFQHILAIDPSQASIRNNLGTALDHLGQPREALKQYLEAIRLQPQEPSFHENAGNVLIELNEFNSALDQFEMALRTSPPKAMLEGQTGWLLSALGRQGEAATHLAQACRLDPRNAVLHNMLGEVLEKLGLLQDAQKEFAEAVRLQPELSEARQNLERVRGTLHGE